jgi:hypothetical protein
MAANIGYKRSPFILPSLQPLEFQTTGAYSNLDLTTAKYYTYIDSRDKKEMVTLRTT